MRARTIIRHTAAAVLVVALGTGGAHATPAVELLEAPRAEESTDPDSPAASILAPPEGCVSPWTSVVAAVGLCVGGGPIGCLIAIPFAASAWLTVEYLRCR